MANREFGRSVAIDNGTAVASGWSTNTTMLGGGLGELFFYDLNGTNWLLTQSYFHRSPLPVAPFPDELGASLALDRDVLMAGAPWYDFFREINGHAESFLRVGTNWTEQRLFYGDQRYNVGPFGSSVGVVRSQTYAILNPEESVRNPETGVELARGVVYLFAHHLPASSPERLSATNSGTTNPFSAVALSGDTLFVGSGNDAVTFSRNGALWNFHSVLSPSGTNFPSLALDGNIALVNGYVFLRNGSNWTEFQKLVLTPTKTNNFDDLYGPSVAIDGSTIVVGADGAVSVFDFVRTNWVETLVLTPSSSSAQPSTFGQSVAISGSRILVGDPYSDLFGTRSGAVYIYTRAAAPTSPATAIAEVVNGYLVGFTLIDGGAGYTYAPPIRIIGGGGIGASAVASVQNGTVTALHILASGSGYLSAPGILIDAPADPLSPPVAAVSQPTWIAVDLHLVAGRQYLFESSSDLRDWTQLGEPFLAEEPTLTEELPVHESAQFFRLTPMPECPE